MSQYQPGVIAIYLSSGTCYIFQFGNLILQLSLPLNSNCRLFFYHIYLAQFYRDSLYLHMKISNLVTK